ncbi:MAG: hypothetical protein ABJA02_10380 [Acidobacteriota bacterium]
MKYLFLVCMLSIFSLPAIAQTRSVTNEDLSKYSREREKADRDYLENYARRGLPSPDEIARRRARSAIEYREYADQIRAHDAEVERAAAQWRSQRRGFVPQVIVVSGDQGYGEPDYFYSGGRYFSRGVRQPYSQPGYYAGGQFWPTGSATPSRPLIARPRH